MACSMKELKLAKKKRVPVGDREVLLIYHHNEVVALDSICYHLGGPLIEGDIEDIDGISCITCPWHSYKIDIKTGEGVYFDSAHKLITKGKRQRTHKVRIENDNICVTLDNDPNELPSDCYAKRAIAKYS
uniref:Rieske domain-containing protein n=1 Tax=Arcella intermedia TaxID=1963864 RepID=A0A6B2LQE8_9EUKA